MVRSRIQGLKNQIFSGRLTTAAILVSVLAIPSAIAMRLLSLNQALILSLGFIFVNIQAQLSRRMIICLAFALALLFVPIPARYFWGIDLVPLLSIALLIFGLTRKSGAQKSSQPDKNKIASFYFIAALSFSILACLSSLLNYRSPDFITWVLFPIASAIIVKLLRSEVAPTFKDFMEYWTIGASLLMLVDALGLLTSRYRSTDLFNAGRFHGTLGDYELSAEFYGISALVALYVLLVTEGKLLRGLALLEVVGFGALLVATQTRSSFLLAMLGAILILFSSTASKRIKRSFGALALVGSGSSIVLLGGGLFQDAWNRLAATELNQDFAGVANRSGVWNYFQNLSSFTNLSPIGNGFSYPYAEIQSYPHSLYLWVLWSGGILSLFILFLLACVAIGTSVSRWREYRVDASASLVILGFLFLDQSKVEVARFASTSWVFWLLIALTFSRFERRDKVSRVRNGK